MSGTYLLIVSEAEHNWLTSTDLAPFRTNSQYSNLYSQCLGAKSWILTALGRTGDVHCVKYNKVKQRIW